MKQQFLKLSAIAVISLSSVLSAQVIHEKVDTSIFPKVEKGMTPYVIEVPYGGMESDADKRIEVIIGKNEQVDKCNRHMLNGTLEKKDLKGYGYNYYEFKSDGNIMSTMMGCSDTGKVTKFVSSQSTMMNYNGRMPIVIYVPEGYEVKYKIYKAEDDVYQALQLRSKNK